MGDVVTDIKVLAASFPSATFRHVRCSMNESAHILARTCDVTTLCFISVSTSDSIGRTLCIDVM
jgi:hypothetical protein